jgi:uncharacterized membrane protein
MLHTESLGAAYKSRATIAAKDNIIAGIIAAIIILIIIIIQQRTHPHGVLAVVEAGAPPEPVTARRGKARGLA